MADSDPATSFGRPGDPQKADLAIKVAMTDNRFTPAEIRVKVGDTVRFLVDNEGKRERQMVLGTMDVLEQPARPGEPNEVDVAPGQTGELAWQFTEIGEFYYGFADGRVGKVLVY